MYKIVIVEDDQNIRNELGEFLNKNGYETTLVVDFKHAVEKTLEAHAHVLLLDLNLPIVDGYYICREIRKQSNLPIIVVTSRDSEMDELMSMNLGADDFVTKPYNLQILLARIERLINRAYEHEEKTSLMVGDIILDMSKSLLQYQDQTIELTKNEFRILHCLFRHKNEIVSRDELMNDMWDGDLFVDDNALTVNINRVRKKLDYIGLQDLVQTKRGLGYIVYED
ncbi:DNA-binding response OmpR family regulator [Breznakia sp. PF5-3]|uniref:response regulator transcription factor n=1 Tax=unclassified Breznakia TaxID=2623764 RepID=UPI0024055EAC|nr:MULTISPECIES: response regulator transcription factor [unclassified Breznakia]MDL2276603.1 response regulator transcription factor [Breznakia sp. OttesenSCG-928-G09]MDF9823774.1 DNA-binding response OmpR family regulator [Breznakia sp. PM6-1]MDF9834660.1 DNA-binding response OmpR family regulator [Breznakia sp. PF5-3]MDF9836723.1 DNA-binding response OmpR family regulator [Breznakia sp. PFB2-8]MDF9858828.1 DNA-binding response OmpR family regulator [Breznakia sp. PH5-24]